MAERKVTLTLKPREEEALSHLVAWACMMHGEDERISRALTEAQWREIANLNGALNAVR